MLVEAFVVIVWGVFFGLMKVVCLGYFEVDDVFWVQVESCVWNVVCWGDLVNEILKELEL